VIAPASLSVRVYCVYVVTASTALKTLIAGAGILFFPIKFKNSYSDEMYLPCPNPKIMLAI